MLYLREPEPLHLQHVNHMQTTGLCYDNLLRLCERNPFSFFSFARRLKYAGLSAIYTFLFGCNTEYRATGLHFISVRQYYERLTEEKIEMYKKQIYDMSFLRYVMTPNDEILLYKILENEGLHPERLGLQTDPVTMLDFNNTQRLEFRPHHGIHLGIFRLEPDDIKNHPSFSKILNSSAYDFYRQQYRVNLFNDPVFQNLISVSSSKVKSYFEKLHEVYDFQ